LNGGVQGITEAAHADGSMIVWLDGFGATFALAAALAWFYSAARNPPQMRTYWDAAPPNDPLVTWMQESARMNRWAALFSGLAALCAMLHFAAGAAAH
jgi:hypothetical protein